MPLIRSLHRWAAPVIVTGLGLSLSGCFDQQQAAEPLPWTVQELSGDPVLLNQKTGEVFVAVDNYLLEVEKLGKDDLANKTISTSNLLSLDMNAKISMAFTSGRISSVVSVDPRLKTVDLVEVPTEEGLAAIKRLESIVKGEDEDIAGVTLELRDEIGATIDSIRLKEDDIKYMVNSEGVTTALQFNPSIHLDPSEYARIESLDYSWGTRK